MKKSLFVQTEELLQDKTIWEELQKEHDTSEPTGEQIRDTDGWPDTKHLDAFMPGLNKFQDYLVSLNSPIEFVGTELVDIMKSLQEPLEAHFRSEISTIANLAHHQRTPKEGSEEEKATEAAFDSREGKSLVKSGMADVLPFFLFNFDREYEDGL